MTRSKKALIVHEGSPDPKSRAKSRVTSDDIDMIAGGVWSRPGFLVRRLHQIHCALFYEECSEGGVTPVQYGILTVLASNAWLDQTAIGLEVGLDRTTTADVIRRLEEKGWVTRRVNEEDRRSRQTAITVKGQAIMHDLQRGMERSQQRMLQELPVDERKTFMFLLRKLVEANNHHGRATLKPAD